MANSEYYKGLLERLRNDVHRKRPEKWANGFILHHDNTPCHISLSNFCQIKILRCASSTLFTRSGTVQLLALPQSQNDHER